MSQTHEEEAAFGSELVIGAGHKGGLVIQTSNRATENKPHRET